MAAEVEDLEKEVQENKGAPAVPPAAAKAMTFADLVAQWAAQQSLQMPQEVQSAARELEETLTSARAAAAEARAVPSTPTMAVEETEDEAPSRAKPRGVVRSAPDGTAEPAVTRPRHDNMQALALVPAQ